MEVLNSMQVPEDVPFDERLFESNSLLKQQWETSIGGRAELANLSMQRAAAEDDLREETFRLQESLTAAPAPAFEPSDEVVDVMPMMPVLEAPLEAGPVLEPKTTNGVPWWFWLIFGIVVALLVLAAYGAQVQQRPVVVVEQTTPIVGVSPKFRTFASPVLGGRAPIAAGNGPSTNQYKL